MKAKIIRDLIGDALVALILSEGTWYGVRYLYETKSSHSSYASDILKYYWLVAIVIFLVCVLFYTICGLICFKRYNEVRTRNYISDSQLYQYYKEADKCCQYRVYSRLLFVNTSRGIICMEKSDIVDYQCRTVHHTRQQRYTVNGNVRRVHHSNDYYTYHFKLITRYGVFKNTVSNRTVLEDLRSLLR